MIKLFLGRVLKNKIYWIAIVSAYVLLLCSVIYTDMSSGQKYTFISLFFVEDVQSLLRCGQLSIPSMLKGYEVDNYLWMFCPIIVGVPCILTQRVERFELFRMSKNRYFLCKYLSCLILSGCILVFAYLLFALTGMLLLHGIVSSMAASIGQQPIWDGYLLQKLVSVFFEGMENALLGILLAEFLHNKYLILCVPFVSNYLVTTFLGNIFPYTVWKYISPSNYATLLYQELPVMVSSSMLLATGILIVGLLIKIVVERRCDCGQK